MVLSIRIFHGYLERDPAESHCPAGGDNDYFPVGKRKEYPAGHLVRNPPDFDFRGFEAEAGRGDGAFGAVPVCLSDLVRYDADGVFCLERHQDHGGEYLLRAA